MTKNTMPKKKWTAGRGALVIIASLFALSALLRVGSGTGQAIAKEVAALRPTETAPVVGGICQNTPAIESLLADLTGRVDLLNARERKLDERQQTLNIAKTLIDQNLTALASAEAALSATIATSQTAAEDDLARLTSVYENMKPKQASVLFEAMSPEFAAGFVGRMRPDAAAAILTGLSPESAYTISVILAGRNARAPTE